MPTIRPGNQAVLVVVDFQVGVVAASWESKRVTSSVVRAVARARSAGIPVVWIQHESDDLPRGSAVWQLVDGLVPEANEARVYKRYNSSFEATDLDRHLERIGATHVVLAGAMTQWCIRATAYAALERGYDLTLLGDAHTTESIVLADGTTVEASGIIADLNMTVNGLGYPGRTSATTPVEDMDFSVARDGRRAG